MMTAQRSDAVAAARGDRPLDLLIEGAQLVNVYTGEVFPADIGISGSTIVHVGEPGWRGPRPRQRLAAGGKFALPGFIDAHVHIESSMMSPSGFAAAVLPRGTTTVVIDPHEIANVLGREGVRYMLEATAALPLRVLAQVPSCVPAVPGLETAGAEFGPEDVAEMLAWDRVIGVAEVMDYVGVIRQSPRMVGILEAALARGTVISGHCPGLAGPELAAYLVAGPASDHEEHARERLLEKLRLGMTIEGRASSFSENMPVLGGIVQRLGTLPANLVLCTDDILPDDLERRGHLDHVVRRAISCGFSPVDAIRAATLQAAQRHRLYDLGAIAPGKQADIVLVEDLARPQADEVWAGGRLVARAGRLCAPLPAAAGPLETQNTVHLPYRPQPGDLAIPARPGRSRERVRVLSTGPDRARDLETVELPVQDGVVDWTAAPGICLVAVLERRGRTGRRGLALLKGLGLERGAVASTVAHDSHNLLVVGRDPGDMALAAKELARCGGGVACAAEGRVLATVPLPIAGLMSPLPLEKLVPAFDRLNAALQGLGLVAEQPLRLIIGLALPVIPRYGVTDQGLVDVERQTTIALWADEP